MKKLLSIVLCMALVLSVAAIPAFSLETNLDDTEHNVTDIFGRRQASVAYYVGEEVDGEIIEGFLEDDVYVPDRMPLASAPEGKYFAGWADENGNYVTEISLMPGENALNAVYKDYPTVVNAEVGVGVLGEGNRPQVYAPTYIDGVYDPTINAYLGSYNGIGEITENGETYTLIYNNNNYSYSASHILYDQSGTAYQVKPNTQYNVTMTFRTVSTSETAVFKFFAGAGLSYSNKEVSGSNSWVNPIYKANTFRYTDGSEMTTSWDTSMGVRVLDVTGSSDWLTVKYTIVTGEFTDALATLFYMAYVPNGQKVHVKDLLIQEVSAGKLSNGSVNGETMSYLKLADSVEDKQSYLIEMSYLATTANGIAFMTADADNIYSNNGYIEGANVAIAQTKVGSLVTGKYLITIDKAGGETGQGDALYLYVPGGSDNLNIHSFSVTKLTNEAGNSLVGKSGVSMIKGLAEDEEQALRYYYNYDTTDGSAIIGNGTSYKVVSRGFLFANGVTRANDAITRTIALTDSGVIDFNTTTLNKCWKVVENASGNYNLTYSTYITKFTAEKGTYNVSNRVYVKGYVVVLVDDVEYTLYGQEINLTVKDVYDLQGFHGEGDFASGEEVSEEEMTEAVTGYQRTLVWNNEFNTNNSLGDLWPHYNIPPSDTTVFSKSQNNVIVENGALTLRVSDDGDGTFTVPYDAVSRDRMSYKYGYLEIRAKVPHKSGEWPALWLSPDQNVRKSKNNGEIDVFEGIGHGRRMTTTLHVWSDDWQHLGSHGGEHEFSLLDVTFGNVVPNDWHTYGFEWTETYMKFYVDGKCYYEVDITDANAAAWGVDTLDCFHDYYYVMLDHSIYEETLKNKGIGGTNEAYSDFVIDYIRLYQLPETEDVIIY